jgi:glycosyltransferase involved in cell wall biosynthesis
MKISIITVSFNSASTIEDTLKSVLSQDYKNIEYIIIDGGSTDGTLDIVNRYKEKIKTIVSSPDQGIYDAMNKGIELSSGDVIGILNSDDLFKNDKVLSLVNESFISDIDAVYGDIEYVDRFDLNKRLRLWIAGEFKFNSFKWGWMPPHPGFFIKKAKYSEFGLYLLGLGSSADYELMLRMIIKHQIKLKYLPRIITKMRMGGVSNKSVKNRLEANKNDRLAWKINGLKPFWFTTWLKPVRKIGQFFRT